MVNTKDVLILLNPWWKERIISNELARPYKRKVFTRVSNLIKYRQIVILSGLRRVGKTTLLYQIIRDLLKKRDANKILYFNFDKTISEVIDILDLYQELTGIDWKKEKIFVFFDEIAKLDTWANKIKLIYDAFPNIKFFISSSSSIGLESEAIKNLAGRYFLINIKPLSFNEYLELRKKDNFLKNIKLYEKEIINEFKSYLLRSFPEITDWDDELLIKDYLRTTIIDKIVKEDLPDKFKNVNRDLLLRLIEIFYNEPGFYLDFDNISKNLGISKKTLFRHIFYLEFSYLIKRIKNFRISSMSASRKLQRVYPYWWSLAFCYSDNYDKIIENVVISSIDAKYYWRKNGKEIDCLITDKKIVPIEVKNKKEISKNELKNIKYFLKKYRVKDGFVVYNGKEHEIKFDMKKIIFIPLWKWILEKDLYKQKRAYKP